MVTWPIMLLGHVNSLHYIKVHRCPKSTMTLFTPGQLNTTLAYYP